jgi:exopolysaccharide biosynthesis protein
MTLEELAKYLAGIGCTEAMNLDGGASSQLMVGGKVMNKPSAGRERNTATGLIVLQKSKP